MDPADLRLDGNAAAGMLMGIFGQEMTDEITICGHCRGRNPIGRLHVYTHGMGAIVRCPNCGGVQMRVAEIRGAYAVDLRGVMTLRVSRS
jgi:hypothetical protein